MHRAWPGLLTKNPIIPKSTVRSDIVHRTRTCVRTDAVFAGRIASESSVVGQGRSVGQEEAVAVYLVACLNIGFYGDPTVVQMYIVTVDQVVVDFKT